MKAIADTGFLVAFGNRRDLHHTCALQIAQRVTEPLLTCEAVLAAHGTGDPVCRPGSGSGRPVPHQAERTASEASCDHDGYGRLPDISPWPSRGDSPHSPPNAVAFNDRGLQNRRLTGLLPPPFRLSFARHCVFLPLETAPVVNCALTPQLLAA